MKYNGKEFGENQAITGKVTESTGTVKLDGKQDLLIAVEIVQRFESPSDSTSLEICLETAEEFGEQLIKPARASISMLKGVRGVMISLPAEDQRKDVPIRLCYVVQGLPFTSGTVTAGIKAPAEESEQSKRVDDEIGKLYGFLMESITTRIGRAFLHSMFFNLPDNMAPPFRNELIELVKRNLPDEYKQMMEENKTRQPFDKPSQTYVMDLINKHIINA